jgi:3-isopropylmalate/(R)-2-methylmalate dehydratase small subunit
VLKGKVFKFGDNISTDLIAYWLAHLAVTAELAKHVLEDADPTFASCVNQDFCVGG